MKTLLLLLSLLLATNAWAEFFHADCELATHKRKGTPLTQFKDVCSEDLKSECHYSEIQLIIDFQTYHPRRNYWSLKGYEDVQVMVQALKDGIVDFIATDHAPHNEIGKLCTFDEADFGISGLETAFGSVPRAW